MNLLFGTSEHTIPVALAANLESHTGAVQVAGVFLTTAEARAHIDRVSRALVQLERLMEAA